MKEGSCFEKPEAEQLQASLLDWYDRNHRTLPWRRNPHSRAASADDEAHKQRLQVPQQQFIYMVWISEIMCQQTQVARAAEYFTRWLAKWPAVQALAAATLDEVNDLWAGLGYYRRAKYLHSGAQHVVNNLDGVFPTTSKELQKIPGIGAYTGNAIASIACGERVAVVDANVVRVVSRLRRLAGDPTAKAAIAAQNSVAASMLSAERPGCFNQAVMELGATICTGAPKCGECPINRHCDARKAVLRHEEDGGKAADAPSVTQYPAKVVKAKRHEQTVAVCVLRKPHVSKKHKYLLVKRAEKGLLAGLWEFPSVQQQQPEEGKKPPSRLQQQRSTDAYIQESLGVPLDDKISERTELGSVSHVFSHINMQLQVELLTLEAEVGAPVGVHSDGEAAAAAAATEAPAAADSTAAAEGAAAKAVGAESPAKSEVQMRWLTTDELAAEGLSSAMRKVAALVEKHKPKSGKGTLAAAWKKAPK